MSVGSVGGSNPAIDLALRAPALLKPQAVKAAVDVSVMKKAVELESQAIAKLLGTLPATASDPSRVQGQLIDVYA